MQVMEGGNTIHPAHGPHSTSYTYMIYIAPYHRVAIYEMFLYIVACKKISAKKKQTSSSVGLDTGYRTHYFYAALKYLSSRCSSSCKGEGVSKERSM